MTTKEDIKRWFEIGLEKKASYMFIVCDTFDWSDFPSYAHDNEEANKKLLEYESGANMTKLMEIYDLRQNMEKQMNQGRCRAKIK